jgi:agmatine deiminase
MIPDWDLNSVYLADLLETRHPDLFVQLRSTLTSREVDFHLLRGVKDFWARDYLPIQVDNTTFVKFTYQPDYLRGWEHLITGPEVCEQLPFLKDLHRSDIRLDGGNVVASSRRVILTEKIYRENPSWSRKELRGAIQQHFRVDVCIFIPVEPGDYCGHADGVVRFLDEHRVVINDYSKVDAGYGDRLLRILKRHRLDVEVLPYIIEERLRRNEIGSAVGNYVNYLRIGKLIVMPVYGLSQDEEAIRALERYLPGTDIVPLPSSSLAQEGGVLHCASWSFRCSHPVARNSEIVGQ